MYPFLTNEFSGINGIIRHSPEDFQVTEIPAYPCSGEGEHIFLYIEKSNLTTLELVKQLSQKLKISLKDVGYAGQKDCHALTKQYISIPQKALPLIEKINIPNVKILSIQRHKNKLRLGHLQGNEFRICIRNYDESKECNIVSIANKLVDIGVPNYFGEQRFGIQNNTQWIGKAILQKDSKALLQVFFGTFTENDSPKMQQIKQYFLQGNYKSASEEIPSEFRTEKYILKKLAMGLSPEKIISIIPKHMHTFYICAYQAWLFNEILSQRIENLDNIELGDLAVKHPSRSVFLVEDQEKEQIRCNNKEISASGPIWGYKMIQPRYKPLQREIELLEKENISMSMFPILGERRSLRFFVQNLSWQKTEQGMWISFTLPKSCYATVVLREFMKNQKVCTIDEIVEE